MTIVVLLLALALLVAWVAWLVAIRRDPKALAQNVRLWVMPLVAALAQLFGFLVAAAETLSRVFGGDDGIPTGSAVDQSPVVAAIRSLERTIAGLEIGGAAHTPLSPVLALVTGTPGPFFMLVLAGILLIALHLLLRKRESPLLARIRTFSAFAGAVCVTFAALGAGADLVHKIFPGKVDAPPTPVYQFPQEGRTTVFKLENGISVISGPPEGPIATFVIPFKEEASCSRPQVGGRWVGTVPDPNMDTFLDRLGSDLSACREGGSSAEVKVRGFASSSKMSDPQACGAETSDEANRMVANRRADEIVRLLGDHPGLDVTPHVWESYQEMARERQFNDRLVSGAYSTEMAILTRRAEIQLWEAPACQKASRAISLRP